MNRTGDKVSALEQRTEEREEASGEATEPRESGVGAFLKAEREKRGLTIEHIEEAIKLRKHFVEALENEKWDDLPPPVFVRGFIISYAKSIGLDEKKVLGLYERVAPEEPEAPTPLMGPTRTGKRLPIILLILAAAAVLCIFLWKGMPISLKFTAENQQGAGSKGAETVQGDPTGSEMSVTAVGETESGQDVPEPGEDVPESGEDVPESGQDVPESQALPDSDTQKTEGPAARTTTVGEPQSLRDESSPAEATRVSSETTVGHLLTGIVRERTWVKIFIDGKDPKEYIFQPGSRPQWRATEGFEVVIGNAAGIDFEYNGKPSQGLGNLGQVVRLRFPEDYPGTSSEE